MMNQSKEKRKEKPGQADRTRRGLLALVLLACVLFGIAFAIYTRPQPDLFAAPSIAISAPAFPTLTLELNLAETAPQSPINRSNAVPFLQNDLAWDKPTFASSYWLNGYPSRATNGNDGGPDSDMWRSASSTGSWLYVDLGEAQTFNMLVSTLYVDGQLSPTPETYYIVSDDLKTWRVVYDEVNPDNQANRWALRMITLPEPVTARYVGLYGQDWDDGWADLSLFMVLP